MGEPLRVFIGWDSREPEAYDVARFSLQRRASIPVDTVPIKQSELRDRAIAGIAIRSRPPSLPIPGS